jgi:hypothetical protein
MPFASKSQARFMFAAAKNPKMAKELGIPQSVAKKYVKEGQDSLKRLPEKKKK